MSRFTIVFATLLVLSAVGRAQPGETMIDVDGPGWRMLGGDDFARVNGDDETMVWKDGVGHCTGSPIGVTRSVKTYRNFELVIQWRHEMPGGNSGVFAWVPMSALEDLPPGKLPNSGIEIQMLDHAFTQNWEKSHPGRTADWFSTNGDVFPVGKSSMDPFPPTSPDGSRSFPSAEWTNGHGEWNQYYVRAINGEVRLWVNGHEVSGGKNCSPAEGYLCLESEGSPITFRNISHPRTPLNAFSHWRSPKKLTRTDGVPAHASPARIPSEACPHVKFSCRQDPTRSFALATIESAPGNRRRLRIDHLEHGDRVS